MQLISYDRSAQCLAADTQSSATDRLEGTRRYAQIAAVTTAGVNERRLPRVELDQCVASTNRPRGAPRAALARIHFYVRHGLRLGFGALDDHSDSVS